MGRRVGPLVRNNAPRRRARARPRGCAHSAAKARLSLPLHSEIPQPRKAECAVARHADAGSQRKHSTHERRGGRRRAVADVAVAWRISIFVTRFTFLLTAPNAALQFARYNRALG